MQTPKLHDNIIKEIEGHIQQTGHHVYLVAPSSTPRFAYTIGLRGSLGYDLILAGACYYDGQEVVRIINESAKALRQNPDMALVSIEGLGAFSLVEVDASWSQQLMLGALDVYQSPTVRARQIVPCKALWTIDVPAMKAPYDGTREPVWKWLSEPWPYPVPECAVAVTNLAVLQGALATEVARWEEDNWEVFYGAGPDIPHSDIRPVPLGTLIAQDPTLLPVLDLTVGKGYWRDPDAQVWHAWG